MDQIVVDCGPDGHAWPPATRWCCSARQGDEAITAVGVGRAASAPSPTRCSAASGRGCRGSTDGDRQGRLGGRTARRAVGDGRSAAGRWGPARRWPAPATPSHADWPGAGGSGEDALAGAGLSLPVGRRSTTSSTVSDGGRIHAVERGAGPPLVLVHGITLGVGIWAPQFRQLADRHRVIAIDQRGHGQSIGGAGGYTLRAAGRRRDRGAGRPLEVTDAVVVGHSMGGHGGPAAGASRRPEELRRHVAALVLLATVGRPDGPRAGRASAGHGAGRRGRPAPRRSPTGGARALSPSRPRPPGLARASFGSHPGRLDVELARSMIAAMSPAAMAGLLGPLLAFDVRTTGSTRSTCPPRWWSARRDLLTPPRMARVHGRRGSPGRA